MHHAYTGGDCPEDLLGGFDFIGAASGPTSESAGSTADATLEGDALPQVFVGEDVSDTAGAGILDTVSKVFGNIADSLLPAGPSTTPTAFPVATIRDVQKALNVLGFGPLEEDNILGPMTKAAVKRYQTTKGLNPDGVPGPLTKAALQADVAARVPSGGVSASIPSIFGAPSDPSGSIKLGPLTIPNPFALPNPFSPPATPVPSPSPSPSPAPLPAVRPSAGPLGLSPPMLVGLGVLGLGVIAGAAYLLSSPKKSKKRKA